MNELAKLRLIIRNTGVIIILLTGLLTTCCIANTVSVEKNKASGLLKWKVKDKGFSLELIQLIPDFVRAVYSKHQLPKKEVERIAGYCVFGSILRNTSSQQMSYRVADWRYRTKDGIEHPVKTKTQWLKEWKKSGIAFSWTLLADRGVFNVGDWIQGFTTIKLPRNTEFDLIYSWKLDGVAHSGTIKNIRCAPANFKRDKK